MNIVDKDLSLAIEKCNTFFISYNRCCDKYAFMIFILCVDLMNHDMHMYVDFSNSLRAFSSNMINFFVCSLNVEIASALFFQDFVHTLVSKLLIIVLIVNCRPSMLENFMNIPIKNRS